MASRNTEKKMSSHSQRFSSHGYFANEVCCKFFIYNYLPNNFIFQTENEEQQKCAIM